MHWQDEGIIIASQRHGEKGAVLSLLTREHGRHKGYINVSSKVSASLQIGTLVQASWHARLSEHLGTWSLEPLFSPVAYILRDPLKLGALTSSCSLLESLLAEREPHPRLFDVLQALVAAFKEHQWIRRYCAFEQTLLREGGVYLRFDHCALTGRREDLAYVSPRTGRAVTVEAGEPYKKKLLPLPAFLAHEEEKPVSPEDFKQALELFDYFFDRYLLSVHHIPMPLPRERLKELVSCYLKIKKAA